MEPARIDPYAPPAEAPPPEPDPVEEAHRPKVGGWLLFFCVGQTILLPLVSIGRFSMEWTEASPSFEAFPIIRTAFLIDGLMSVGIVGFAVYAGARLWGRARGAVKLAKSSLVLQLVYAFAAGFIPMVLLSDLGPAVRDAMTQEWTKGITRTLVSFAIWFTYLSRSQRVKQTFPAG